MVDDGTIDDNIRQLEESDEDSDDDGDGKKRRISEDGTSVVEPSSPGTKRRRKRRQFRQYYTGSFYGSSSSSLMYTLAQQLNKADRELLWSVCELPLCHTDSHCQTLGSPSWAPLRCSCLNASLETNTICRCTLVAVDVLSLPSYRNLLRQIAEFQDEVSRTCTEGAQEMAMAETAVSCTCSIFVFSWMTSVVQGQTLTVHAAEDHRIVFEEEFRFMMYRHWSLLESMSHSDYIAAKFEIWTSVGQKKLKTMIAQMGIALKEAEQSYYHMVPKAKRALRDLMVEVGKEFGLDDVTYGSFHLRNGYKFQLSASDAVYGITALLTGHGQPQAADAEAQEELCRSNFWEAFDALSNVSSKTTEKIEEGIRKAIELQKAVVKQGSHMLSKRIITTSGVFRYAYLRDTADTHLFLNPQVPPLTFRSCSHCLLTVPPDTRPSPSSRIFWFPITGTLCTLNGP